MLWKAVFHTMMLVPILAAHYVCIYNELPIYSKIYVFLSCVLNYNLKIYVFIYNELPIIVENLCVT